MADHNKVEIGFGIGQALSVKLKDDELAELRKAVGGEGGWYDLRTQDSMIALNLATVVFIRVDDSDHSIGFSGA
ncbi:MAG: hypothetical protein ACR2G3_04150 [Solirubrobacterales bacterium]